ncbi:hypothetical protein [Gordonia pseudamarae]|uniref:Uncharacterized protein n=1 Tax=Gordonia pseudamarae TaxID=2831662 RepID=A0ABX6IHL0_9ACTN|nr:hypothetical protein [Gordonia pseudamarae]QHN34765.1 hypothetical protein GII31_07500 [Gordonia pseudamarae]
MTASLPDSHTLPATVLVTELHHSMGHYSIPVDFALYEVEFELILMRENEEPSAYLNPIIDRAISNLGLSR